MMRGNTMNTNDMTYRLDDVLDVIIRKKSTTAGELAAITGKTSRTINRDIQFLKKKYPQIKTKHGHNGGIYWEEKKGEDRAY